MQFMLSDIFAGFSAGKAYFSETPNINKRTQPVIVLVNFD